MQRIRKRVKKRILFWTGCIVVQILVILLCRVTVKQVTAGKYEALLEEKNAVLEAARRTVYITRTRVSAGETFTEENTEKRYLLSEQNPEALAVEAIGLTACADLPAGVIINTALCCEQECSPTERRCVFYSIGFAEDFAPETVVDVRIRYANGENYCVLKKKRLQKASEEGACSFFLDEEEQLLMSAAQYDVELYDGAKLYLVGFMEERLQEDAMSAYLPSVQIISQLREWNEDYRNSFEQWCALRTALENRLLEHRMQRMNGLL